MSLQPGTRLGPYEILASLGAGGMGEVWKAKDTRLDRFVAVKVLPEHLAKSPDALARFEREAKAVAALNHPNIVAIHDFGQSEGIQFVVMELLEGETLRDRLRVGALSPQVVRELVTQMASGLSAAHSKGIVHRDLKPENLWITSEGRMKILDFGLAKQNADQFQGVMSQLETQEGYYATKTGSVLGTLGYMSPEQVRGEVAGPASDVFSLGVVMLEMLTGKPPFNRANTVDTLHAILHDTPPALASIHRLVLPKGMPNLLKQCLEKNPGLRIPDAMSLALALAAISPVSQPPAPSQHTLVWIVGTAVVLSGILLGPRLWRGLNRAPFRQFQITVESGTQESPCWSPDGQSIAYAAEVGPVRKLFLRQVAGGERRQITLGDTDDFQPFWSPDGRTLYFTRARKTGQKSEPGDPFGVIDDCDIWVLTLATGEAKRILEQAANPACSPDGKRLAFDATWSGNRRIWMADANGFNPFQVTRDTTDQTFHFRPRWSPMGRLLTFTVQDRALFNIKTVDLQSGQQQWVTHDVFSNMQAVWAPSGRYIYFSSYRSGINLWRIPVDGSGKVRGAAEQVTTGAGEDVEVALSQDGKRLTYAVLRQNADLWLLPVAPDSGRPQGEPRPLVTSSREDSRGALSTDGTLLAFNSDRSGDMNIWVHDLATHQSRPITRGPGADYQPSWSPDGRYLAFFSSRSGHPEIWRVEVATGALTQLTQSAGVSVAPEYAPDGSVIAFQSDRGGRLEVYLMDADGGHVRAITSVGVRGHFLVWAQDGQRLIFRAQGPEKSQTMQVPCAGGEATFLADIKGGAHMSLSPGGTHLMDVIGHKVLWVSPLAGGSPYSVFQFTDPRMRIDFPRWAPALGGVLFDRVAPEGGDIWAMEGFE